VRTYLETASPVRVIDRATNQPVADLSNLPERVSLERGDFKSSAYEWGVTYAGMLLAAEATDDARFRDFTANGSRRSRWSRASARERAGQSASDRPRRQCGRAKWSARRSGNARRTRWPVRETFFLRSVIAPRSLE